jgi:hypothetical protein
MGISVEEFWTKEQQDDLQFYQEIFESLLADPLYKSKYVLIHSKKVSGFFDTFEAALADAASKYQPGAYIIQQVISDKEVVDFIYPAIALA